MGPVPEPIDTSLDASPPAECANYFTAAGNFAA